MVTKKLFDPQKQMQNNNLMKSVFNIYSYYSSVPLHIHMHVCVLTL